MFDRERSAAPSRATGVAHGWIPTDIRLRRPSLRGELTIAGVKTMCASCSGATGVVLGCCETRTTLMSLKLASTTTLIPVVLLTALSSASAQTSVPATGSTSGYTGVKAPTASVGGYGGVTSGYGARTNAYATTPSVDGGYGKGGGVRADAVASLPLTPPAPKRRVKVDSAGHTWTWDESLGVWRDPVNNAMRYMEPQ